MVGRFWLRPGRAALIAVMMVAMASMAFAHGSAEKKGGTVTGQAQVAVVESGPGVLVVGVLSGSPAEKAGIVRGDIILQADGKDLTTGTDLQRAVTAHKAGDTLSLKIKHGDAEKTLSVTLADLNNTTYLGVESYGARLGLGMVPFAAQLNDELRAGAVVAHVVSGAPADKAGIKTGDVIVSVDGAAVTPQNDLSGLIAQHKPGDTVTLSVESSGQKPRDVKVTLGTNPQKADAPYLGIQYSLGAGRLGMAPFAPMPFGPWMNQPYRNFRNNGGNQVFQGVMVDAVADNSPAAQAGIKARDVITAIDGVTILAPRQVVDTVANHKSGDKITVTVFRFNENKSTDISVTLGSPPAGSQAKGAYMGITMSRYIGYTSPDANGPQTDLQAPSEKPLALPAPGGA
jgi:S1-C subfamily serine protease